MQTAWLRRVCAFLVLSALVGGACAQVRIEGQTFDAKTRVADSELRLNGVGLRAVAWLKGYAAGLYLTRKAGTQEQALSSPGPKRLQMRMLQDVDAAEFVKAIGRGLAKNHGERELAALRDRTARFEAMVDAVRKVRKGDVVDLDFLPGSGMVFSMNGVVRGAPIPGEDFYAGILKIFIGDRPVDAELKRGLLGGPVG